MTDDRIVNFKLDLPPPNEADARAADKLAIGIFMMAEKLNTSPTVMLYALHRVIDKMSTMARSHG